MRWKGGMRRKGGEGGGREGKGECEKREGQGGREEGEKRGVNNRTIGQTGGHAPSPSQGTPAIATPLLPLPQATPLSLLPSCSSGEGEAGAGEHVLPRLTCSPRCVAPAASHSPAAEEGDGEGKRRSAVKVAEER